MQLLFNVPPEADGVLLRGFLRRCAVSTEPVSYTHLTLPTKA